MSFFSDRKDSIPCGMFSLTHIIVLIICLISVAIALYLTRNKDIKQINKMTKIWAIVFAVLETIKIIYNFYYGYTELIYWFPFSFCSLFIYALFLSGYAKGKLKRIGDIFIGCGALVSGFAFLLVPSTSLTEVSMFHFLSTYSMLYHSVMLFFGFTYIFKHIVIISKKELLEYSIFCVVVCTLALIISVIFDSNLMFVRDPRNVPVKILKDIALNIPYLYPIVACACYIILPFSISYMISKMVNNTKKVK